MEKSDSIIDAEQKFWKAGAFVVWDRYLDPTKHEYINLYGTISNGADPNKIMYSVMCDKSACDKKGGIEKVLKNYINTTRENKEIAIEDIGNWGYCIKDNCVFLFGQFGRDKMFMNGKFCEI